MYLGEKEKEKSRSFEVEPWLPGVRSQVKHWSSCPGGAGQNPATEEEWFGVAFKLNFPVFFFPL